MDARLADFAAEIGPHLDRLRLGVMREPVEAGAKLGMFAGSGLDPDTLTVTAMLRNTYPDRSVPVRNLRAPFIYQEPAKFETALSRLVETRLVNIAPAKSVTLSDQGRVLISQVRGLNAQAATDFLGSGTIPSYRWQAAASSPRLPPRPVMALSIWSPARRA